METLCSPQHGKNITPKSALGDPLSRMRHTAAMATTASAGPALRLATTLSKRAI